MDIRSGKGYPAAALSNFAPHPFCLQDIQINSMEGFLQSLKFKNTEMQKYVCTLVGKAAKLKGSKKNWRRSQNLYWKGRTVPRHSKEYQELLDLAYGAMFLQNLAARNALKASGNAMLTHSIGKKDPKKTVLTEQEFVSRLMKIRKEIKKDEG